MRFTPTLIAAILSALIVLPVQATPATPTETKASAVTHAKAKAQPKAKATPKTRHAQVKVKTKARAQHVAKASTRPDTAQSLPDNQADQPLASTLDIAPAASKAVSAQSQTQVDPQLLAKAMALAKAQSQMQDAPNAATDAPAAKVSFLDKAGASFQKVSTSLQDTLDDALGLIGIRYRRGGTTPETGFDCSGFVVHVFREGMGLILPRTSRELSKVGEIVKKNDLQPGDLVFFNTMRRTFSHVGIYLGNGQFIHAPRTGSEVRIEDMRESYWVKRYEGARRMEITE